MSFGKEDVLTSRDLEGILKLSKTTVGELLRSGQIPSVRAGRKYLVSRSMLQEWIEGK